MKKVIIFAIFAISIATVFTACHITGEETHKDAVQVPACEGYCLPCAVDKKMLVKGKESISAQYKGQTFYFASEKSKEKFLNNPEKYLNGIESRIAELKAQEMK